MPEHSACYWIREAGGDRIHIPGCMGAAVQGPEACTCEHPESGIERAHAVIRRQVDHLARLRSRLEATRKERDDLKAERAVLRRRVKMIESAAAHTMEG